MKTDQQFEMIQKELRRIRTELHEFKIEMTKEIATLKVKSGLWGAAASTLVLLPGMIIYLMSK